MAIRRDSLRAKTDFFSPMTGNTGTEIRYAAAPTVQNTYGSQVKSRLADIGKAPRRAAPIMEAIKVAVQKTDDPFTQIAEKKSYAPPEENDFMGALEGAGNVEEAIQAVGDVVEPIASSGGSNQRAAQRRADQQFARQEKNPSPRTSTAALVARDNRRYGNTVPSGSFGSGSLSTIKASPTSVVDTNIERHSVGDPRDQPGYEAPKKNLPTTYGGVIGLADSLAKIKAKQDAPKQISNLPSNYKSTEAAAFAKAKAFKGQQAAAKAAAEGKTKAQQAAAARKATGTSIGAAKAANRASMKAKAAARHASFKKAKKAGTHARTASAQRARNKAAAKARAKAAAKARNKAKNRNRRGGAGRRKGRRRCDIFLKFDIRLLTNNNLRHDELAEVAYFVRALREVEL